MHIRSRTAAAITLAASMILFAGCSTGSPAEDAEPSSQVDESTDDTAAEESTDDAAEDADAADDDTAGDVGPAGGAVYTDPTADSVQVVISETGFDPADISVPVGGTVTFTGGDSGPHGLYVGDLDSYSVMGGLTATYRFDTAGTYRVFDEISETEATVTAE